MAVRVLLSKGSALTIIEKLKFQAFQSRGFYSLTSYLHLRESKHSKENFPTFGSSPPSSTKDLTQESTSPCGIILTIDSLFLDVVILAIDFLVRTDGDGGRVYVKH